MFPKLLKIILLIHKQVLLIMLLQRFGEMIHIILKLIYGLWVVSYMSYVCLGHLLMQLIWMVYLLRFNLVNSSLWIISTPKI